MQRSGQEPGGPQRSGVDPPRGSNRAWHTAFMPTQFHLCACLLDSSIHFISSSPQIGLVLAELYWVQSFIAKSRRTGGGVRQTLGHTRLSQTLINHYPKAF